MLDNALAVINGKGGVAKTTTVAHIATIAAASGWRVLAVDADPQGDLGPTLGVATDGGAQFGEALRDGHPVVPTKTSIETLDLVGGGEHIDLAVRQVQNNMMQTGVGGNNRLNACLAPLAADYDLIVIDSPPREMFIRHMVLQAARFLVVPTRSDGNSIMGIASLLDSVGVARTGGNPDLEILAVVLGPMDKRLTRVRADTRTQIEEAFQRPGILTETTISYVEGAMNECINRGISIVQYEEEALAAKPWYKQSASERSSRPNYSSAASTLAAEYQSMVQEITSRFAERRLAVPA